MVNFFCHPERSEESATSGVEGSLSYSRLSIRKVYQCSEDQRVKKGFLGYGRGLPSLGMTL